MTIDKLKKRWRWLDWDRLLNGLLPEDVRPLTNKDRILVREPSYLTKLGKLLNESPSR